MSAPAGDGRGASVGGQKTKQAPQLSAVPPPPQVPGIAANSREAFASVNLGWRQREVYDAIVELWRQGWKPSDQDIARWLNRPINTITGRRGELVVLGQVVKGGDKIGPCSVRVSWWRSVPAAPQGELW